jgi:hypothetical protein
MDRVPDLAQASGDDQWKLAAAGNETNRGRGRRGIRQYGEGAGHFTRLSAQIGIWQVRSISTDGIRCRQGKSSGNDGRW